MTRDETERVEELLKSHFPHADVDVMGIPGGLRIEVHGHGSSMFAVLGSENSVVLAALEPSSEAES